MELDFEGARVMLGRLAAAAALIALAGCAGMESAGRNSRTGEPTRVAATPPPAVRTTPQPAPAAAPPPPVASAPATTVATPPAAPVQRVEAPPPAPVTTVTTAPPAPAQRAETPPPAPQQLASNGDQRVSNETAEEQVIARGQRERQVQAPNGDPRSASERMQDIRAWDQCVMRVQSAFEADPMSAQLDQPEDVCSQSLGMADRTAVPQSRLESRRR